MYAAIHGSKLRKFTPSDWDNLKTLGAWNNWHIVHLSTLSKKIKYVLLTEYEAFGWLYADAANGRGYFNLFETSSAIKYLNSNNLTVNLKKNKLGQVLDKPVRFKYTLDDKDYAQAKAFLDKMGPHVQRTAKSEARHRRYYKLYRIFKKV
jgi:hypothetical protein